MRCADTRAGEHRDREFWDHRHVEDDAVAFLDALGLEHVCELANFAMQFGVRDDPRVAGLAFPNDRGLVAACAAVFFKVPVEAVVTDVQLAADKPLRKRRLPVEHLLPRREPGDVLFRARGPVLFGVFIGLLAMLCDRFLVPVRFASKRGVGFETTRFFE